MKLEDIDPKFRAEQAGHLLASEDEKIWKKGELILESLSKEYQTKAKWRRDSLLDYRKAVGLIKDKNKFKSLMTKRS